MSETSTASALAPIKAHSRTWLTHVGPGQARKPYTDLFFISFAILFLELACIRWFGSAVLFLTFFTNLVLFACFLGMSVGLLATGRRADLVTWVIPLAVAAVGLAELDILGLHSFRKPEHRRRRAGVAAAGLLRDRAPSR